MLCFPQLISILTMKLCAALKQLISYSRMKFRDGGGLTPEENAWLKPLLQRI